MQSQTSTQKPWKAAGVALALLAVGTGGYLWGSRAEAQSENGTQTTAPPAVKPTAAIKDAEVLQNAFTQVAQAVEPAVVTITTRVERPQMVQRYGPGQPMPRSPYGSPFGGPYGGPSESDPFEEFFRRFREFGPDGGFSPNSASPEQLQAQEGFQQIQQGSGLGSGFIFDKSGLILTNAHVVRGASQVTVQLADGREFKNARVLGSDTRSDVAVVKIEGENLPAVTLGNSSQVEVGDWAIAVGNPFGFSNTLTVGVISAKARSVPGNIRSPYDYLQTDASINPGNSGGPLLDIYGRVVGINNSIWSPSGGNIGIGFAIPIDLAKNIADQLIKEGRVRRAELGVGITEIENPQAFGLPTGTQGVLVGMVEPNSPASRAGLQVGDIITAVNGEKVTRPAELQIKIGNAPIGQDATLTVLRNGRTLNLKARLEEAVDEQAQRQAPRLPERIPQGETLNNGSNLGVRIAPLTPDLARELRLEGDARGVVIVGVEPGSPAQRAGLRPGDLIARVGQTPVNSVAEIRDALKRITGTQSGAEKQVALYILRGGQGQYVTVSLS